MVHEPVEISPVVLGICQCGRGSHWSELDHIMHKKRTINDLEECQHLEANRRIGTDGQVLE